MRLISRILVLLFAGILFAAPVSAYPIDDNNIGADSKSDYYDGRKGNVTTSTPEPAAMLLFGCGLVGMTVLGRKKFKTSPKFIGNDKARRTQC